MDDVTNENLLNVLGPSRVDMLRGGVGTETFCRTTVTKANVSHYGILKDLYQMGSQNNTANLGARLNSN